METELQRRILAALESDTAAVLVTVTGTSGSTPATLGARMLVYPDRTTCGTIGGGVLERRAIEVALGLRGAARTEQFALAPGQPGTVLPAACGGAVELLFEPLARSDKLFVAGGGHCAVELVPIARKLGFHVTVIDDRPEWASRERHPQADRVVCAGYERAGEYFSFTDRSYVVIMTHGHQHDEAVLRQCLRRPLRYLGMIGSAKKVRHCFDQLLADGFTRDELARVFAPVGFAVGSQTPAEIAVSIAAQLLAVRNGLSALPFSSNPLLAG